MKDRLSNLKLNRESVRVPQFGHDLFADLRDRHLLPLIAVLLVAIAAVPFLLSASEPELSDTQGEANIAAGLPESASLSVVADAPALREYTDRLEQLTAKDPFVQHFTAPQVDGAQLGGAGGTTTTVPTCSGSSDLSTPTSSPVPSPDPFYQSSPSTTYTETYIPDPPADSGSGGSDGSGGDGDGNGNGGDGGGDDDSTQVKVETKLVSYRISARLGAPGEVKPRKRIPELTMLPNEKNPLAVFLGVSADAKKALVLVSSDVTAVFGDVRCGFGDESCQLLAIEPGLPVVFTYGPKDKRYQVTVTKIERVTESADPRPASQPRLSLGHLLGAG